MVAAAKKQKPATGLTGRYRDPYESSRQPGYHGLAALDPWLCAPVFQQVCLYSRVLD